MINKVLRRLSVSKDKIGKKIRGLLASSPKRLALLQTYSVKINFEKPLFLAHQLVGNRTAPFLPLFKDLNHTLQKSGSRLNFKAYVSLTLLSSSLIALFFAIFMPLFLLFSTNLSLESAFLFGIGSSMLAWVLSISLFYLYPVYRADKHRRALDDELSFTTGYMAILSGARVAPEKIFHSIATLTNPLAASTEAKEVIKDVNLFGLDIISALEKISKRTPSEKFRETIEGIISIIHTGGSLSSFLRNRFKIAMRLKKLGLKKYSDNLSVLSEIYVALLLTGPLLLVIMVSVMSVLGGGDLGILNPDLILSLLTYLVIPVCATIFLIILDTVTPKW